MTARELQSIAADGTPGELTSFMPPHQDHWQSSRFLYTTRFSQKISSSRRLVCPTMRQYLKCLRQFSPAAGISPYRLQSLRNTGGNGLPKIGLPTCVSHLQLFRLNGTT